MVQMVYQYHSRFYQCYRSTNGTIGKTIGTNGNAIGTISSPNGTIGKPMVSLLSQWYHWLPLVKLPMAPLGNPEQSHGRTGSVFICWLAASLNSCHLVIPSVYF